MRGIGAYYSPEKGIVIEGLVPMAIAPLIRCVCVCVDRLYLGLETVCRRGWPRPWRTSEPPGALKRRRLSDRHHCLLARSVITPHLPFSSLPQACHYVSSLGIQSEYTTFSELKKQFHLRHPWHRCRGALKGLNGEMSVFKPFCGILNV